MARALVIRHARSTWNAEGRWQGWSDPPLAPEGEEQAVAGGRALAAVLDPASVGVLVASDLRRAADTARLLGEVAGAGVPVRIDPSLREFDVGAWSGLRRADIRARWPHLLSLWDEGAVTQAPGGEDRAGFEARVRAAVARVAAALEADAAAGQVGLVVTHGRVIGLLALMSGLAETPASHLSGYWVELSAGGVTVTEAVSLLGEPAPALWQP